MDGGDDRGPLKRAQSGGASLHESKRHKESWDSVREQPQCMLCQEVFFSVAELQHHSSFAQVHLRNMQRFCDNRNCNDKDGTADTSAGDSTNGGDSRDVPKQSKGKSNEGTTQDSGPGGRLIYCGNKTFYWTQLSVYVEIADNGTKEWTVRVYKAPTLHETARARSESGLADPIMEATMSVDDIASQLVPSSNTPKNEVFDTSSTLNVSQRHLMAKARERQQMVSTILENLAIKFYSEEDWRVYVDAIKTTEATPSHSTSLEHSIETDPPSEEVSKFIFQRHQSACSLGSEHCLAPPVEAGREPGDVGPRQTTQLPTQTQAKHPKLRTVAEAVDLIKSGDTVTVSGFVGSGHPEALILGLAAKFHAAKSPSNLTLVYGVAQGNAKGRGFDVLAVPGLLVKVIAAHSGVAPGLQRMFEGNQLAAFNIPLGVLSQLYREIASGKPGTLTRVGVGTFIDPRDCGGALNEKARSAKPIVELVTREKSRKKRVKARAGGDSHDEFLFFPSFDINVAILRGTTADCKGNISIEEEAVVLDILHQAMAVHNRKGVVIVQVKQVVDTLLPPRSVAIPGVFVDVVVVAEPRHHWQTLASSEYDPSLAGQIRKDIKDIPPLALQAEKVIARRAVGEVNKGTVVNLGLGIPEMVARVMGEEGCLNHVCLTAEAGVIGGLPESGLRFGTTYNADMVVPTSTLFDFYSGGGLDLACLGFAQVDREGNVNVGKFDGRFPGVGGFVDISQNAQNLLFLGTMTAGDLETKCDQSEDGPGGELRVLQEGRIIKFVNKVEQVTFSGNEARREGKRVKYVTERAVFALEEDGLVLVEVAPGIDMERDVLSKMDFSPRISSEIRLMDPSIFTPKSFNLPLQLK